MDLVGFSIRRPVAVAVGVLLVVMFGFIALGSIPIQLTPTVDKPVVTVTTAWPGRSPQEIVDEITREQEKRLKNVANLKSMRSTSSEGTSEISLEFYLGSDINRALQEVSDALRQVPDYPDDVDEPLIKAADGASENAIAWIIIDLDPKKAANHPGYDISTLFDALDKEVKPYLERIDGVAEVNIYGGREREVRVLLDLAALAQRSINHVEVMEALRAANRNISAGTIEEGKRDYRVRVMGQFVTADDVLDTIITYREGKPVFVRDVATVEFSHQKSRGFVRSLGAPCLAMNVIRQSNANVVDVMEGVRARLDEVRSDILPLLDPAVGPDLRMRQVYDETTYIDSAIDLVNENLIVGSVISAIVLLLFLRSVVSTAIICISIPISVIGTFLIMAAFGRTLNVISLAGLAFATGVVVDNATVVLENIVRRLQMGDPPMQAALRAGREVWGAILAGTLTCVAVFIPVLTIKEEAGQLFADISLAIAASTFLSLIVAITVIPAAASRLMRKLPEESEQGPLTRAWYNAFGLAALGDRFSTAIANFVHWAMTGWRAWSVRPLVIFLMTGLSLLGARMLAPPLDYLPTGNRNLVFGGLLIPPGYSVSQQTEIAERIEGNIAPYVTATWPDETRQPEGLPPIPRLDAPGKTFEPVGISNFFIGAFGGGMFIGGVSADEERVLPVGNVLTNSMMGIPGAFGGARQTSIFGGIRGGNSVNIEISGPNLEKVTAAAQMVFMTLGSDRRFGFRNITPDPANFNLTQPEWRARLTPLGRELGLTTRDVGTAIRGLFDGAFVDDFFLGGDTVDLVVMPSGGRLAYKEQAATIPVSTPSGRIVPLDSVVQLEDATAPQQIQRIEELPAVTVRVTPPQGMTVQEVMQEIDGSVLPAARAAGAIDKSMRVRLEGTAAQLDEIRRDLFGFAPPEDAPIAGWRKALYVVAGITMAGALAVAAFVVVRTARAHKGRLVYGAVGALLMGLVIAALFAGIAYQPQMVTARFIWALAVTYLLMCALFESFLYPLVIMFSVPFGIVGGFIALGMVHAWTLTVPTKAPQQLDVLTMLGFVILIGTVVNNAILLVEQAQNFMNPARSGGTEKPLPPLEAVRESVRTRIRPIFMTSLTTVTGALPLVIAPGSGSEMYRGLGAVVLGGMIVSTVFTLVLVPLAFSITIDMKEALRAAFSRGVLPATPVRAASAPVLAAPQNGVAHQNGTRVPAADRILEG